MCAVNLTTAGNHTVKGHALLWGILYRNSQYVIAANISIHAHTYTYSFIKQKVDRPQPKQWNCKYSCNRAIINKMLQ